MQKEADGALFGQFQYTANLMQRYMHQVKRSAGEADFEHGQGRLMRLLGKEEAGVAHKDLAEKMRIRPASLSELLKKLTAKGYVERLPNPADKRMAFYRLTPEGAAMAAHLEQVKRQYGSQVFEQLSEDEAQQLMTLLKKVAGSLEERTK